MSVHPLIEHDGVTYQGTIMKINKTTLGYGDYNMFSGYLHCSAPGSGISVGGITLDDVNPLRSKTDSEFPQPTRIGIGFGIDWLREIIEIVGVDSWEKLVGERLIVLFRYNGNPKSLGVTAGQTSAGIANIDSGKAMVFEDFFNKWIASDTERKLHLVDAYNKVETECSDLTKTPEGETNG